MTNCLLSPYAKDTDLTAASNSTAAALIATNAHPIEAAIAAAIKDQAQSSLEQALLEHTDHQIRQIWIHGLEKPAREAAKAESKRLTLPQLFCHMDQYATDGAKKNANRSNPARTKNKKKVFEVEEEADIEEDVNEVKKKREMCKCSHWLLINLSNCYWSNLSFIPVSTVTTPSSSEQHERQDEENPQHHNVGSMHPRKLSLHQHQDGTCKAKGTRTWQPGCHRVLSKHQNTTISLSPH